MKQLFTTMICLFLLIANSNAQQNPHLEFMGSPIDGSISSFVEKLEQKCFTKEKVEDNVVTMSGKFVGKNCELYVMCTPVSKIATKVSLYLPKDESLCSLKADYKKYKEMYTTKYGEPRNSFDFFSSPYYEGDGYETQTLRKEKCHYAAYWGVPGGSLAVSISEFCQIQFVYEDWVNFEIMKNERDQSAMNDI